MSKWIVYHILKVGAYNLIIHTFIFGAHFKTRFFFSANEETFGKILSGNHRFLIPVRIVLAPHSFSYLLHQASHFYVTKVLSIEYKYFLQLTICLFCCFPLGPIMSEIINASATRSKQ